MKISSNDFRVPEGDEVNLAQVADEREARVQVEEAL